jgi:CheY-like chemotaxis protein
MPRILVIDDEASFRSLLRQILERAGYEVLDAPDGLTGLKLYRENLIDLAIIDLSMPEVTGIDLIQQLRKQFPDAKIIAISGGGPKGDFDLLPAARVLGAQRAFLKPFNHQELLAAIKELIPV